MDPNQPFSPALPCPRCGKHVFVETGEFYKCLGCGYRCSTSDEFPVLPLLLIPVIFLLLI